MILKLNPRELTWLSGAFANPSPISLFANVQASPDGSEYASLSAKGVLAGQSYAPDALALLLALSQPLSCARLYVDAGFMMIEIYVYRTPDGRLILAENSQGELVCREISDFGTIISDLGELTGLSQIRSSDMAISLPPDQAMLLLTLIDLYRQKTLLAYALSAAKPATGPFDQSAAVTPANPATATSLSGSQPVRFKNPGSQPILLTVPEITTALQQPYQNGLVQIFMHNYAISLPGADRLQTLLNSLIQQGCIQAVSSQQPGYQPAYQPGQQPAFQLTDNYSRFAGNFLIPEIYILNEVLQTTTPNQILAEGNLYLTAGIHDILSIRFEAQQIVLAAYSPLQMLMTIEEMLFCPELADAQSTPAATPATTQPATAQPYTRPAATQPASSQQPVQPAAWRCQCGHTNTNQFCSTCGRIRPK